MGVKGLTQFIRQKVPLAVTKTHCKNLAHKKVAVDVAIYIFKFKCTAGYTWLQSFKSMCHMLTGYHLKPLFVFDSQAPPEKLIEQTRRRTVAAERKKSTEYLKQALHVYKLTGEMCDDLRPYASQNPASIEDALKSRARQEITITKDDINHLKQLLGYLRIPYIQAHAEAEATCAYLCHQKDVDYILTDDSDVLAYGQSYLSKLSSSGECYYTHYPTILAELEMYPAEFLDFCILLGTDYNDRVKGYGPVKALKAIKDSAHLENIAAYNDGIDIQNIRRLFAYRPYPLNSSEIWTPRGGDEEGYHEFCFKNHIIH